MIRAMSTQRPSWVPANVDTSVPSPARVYDVHLDGAHNFAVDREAAAQVRQYMPELPLILRENRAFLRRAVRFLVDAGITQFLDLGSGIPTVGNVHEVAQGANPDCRIVYVDIDPVAVAHSKAILAGNPTAIAVRGDLRQPETILTDPQTRDLLDFTRPIGVLMFAVLHFVDDVDDPAGIVAHYRDAVVRGSHVAISHASLEGSSPDRAGAATEEYTKRVADFYMRGRRQITRFLDRLELVDPGMVYLNEWRPDAPDESGRDPGWTSTFAAVGRKP